MAAIRSGRQARLDLERDVRFGWDMWAWARLQAAAGKSAVYYYAFEQRPPFLAGSVHAGWGASHFAELWYMSDHLDQSPWRWSADDRKLADAMLRYWANFARAGDPNGKSLARWPAFSGAGNDVLYLGSPIRTGGVPGVGSLQVLDAGRVKFPASLRSLWSACGGSAPCWALRSRSHL